MARFALLVRESANRVYSRASPRLLVAELAAVASPLRAEVDNVATAVIGGVDYVVFEADDLGDADLTVLSNLSTARAVFEHRADGALFPLEVTPTEHFDDDLITIQRYAGKTNEQFTHLLVNLTAAASRAADERAATDRPIRLLDPVAGRGSTLNRGLTYGFDVTGIEMVEADVDQYRLFLTTYLKEHRIKHRVTRERVKKGPLAGTSRFGVTIRPRRNSDPPLPTAPVPESSNPTTERPTQEVVMVRGETTDAAALLDGRRFDVVVGDLPYGVQHRAAGAGAGKRAPAELVAASIDGWVSLMGRGAALGVAWNLRTMPRSELAGILTSSGLTVVEHASPFAHTVDRSIERDVIVAVR